MGVVLYAANEGYLKSVDVNKVGAFEAALLSFMKSEYGELMSRVNEKGDWNDELEAGFKAALDQFVASQTW